MPCNSAYLAPNMRERMSVNVKNFLLETGHFVGPFDRLYGDVAALDKDTATLCAWCTAHQDDVKNKSLELQIWWRDHQIADKKRGATKKIEAERYAIRQRALAKLTEEELSALLD